MKTKKKRSVQMTNDAKENGKTKYLRAKKPKGPRARMVDLKVNPRLPQRSCGNRTLSGYRKT